MAAVALKGRRITVVGYNPSAVALLKFLIKRGSQAVLVDAQVREQLEPQLTEQLDMTRFILEAGEIQPKAFEGSDLVIVTPGFPMEHKVLEQVRTSNIPVVSELDFVSQYIDEPIYAITGTNGKTITAHLLAQMVEADGRTAFSNALQPLANYLVSSKTVDVVIAETNSFQLEGITSFKPKAVALLNLTEDFLNRYPNLETYYAIHREILKNADAETLLFVNGQDPNLIGFAPQLAGQSRIFSTMPLPEGMEGAWFTRSEVFVRTNQIDAEPIQFSLKNFKLRGSHNRENLLAAILMALSLNVKHEAIQKVIDEVTALPNRVEFVRRINSVAFYNDAFGTNPNAVVRTLQAFNEPVILISGGRDKNADYSPLIPHIRQRVKNLILVGEAKEKINRAIGDYTETFLVGTLEEAVILAYQKSRSGDVILFSPGCEATDAFPNEEAKGEFFRRLVTQISQPRRPNVI